MHHHDDMPTERGHSFADIEKYVKRFEDPERVRWQKPDEVVRAMALKNGDRVADIGAGTGYFARRIAKAVAPAGSVTGYDTEKSMVEYMRGDAKKLGLPNYRAETVDAKKPALPDGAYDVIFMCNTYHHMEGRVDYLKHVKKSLKKNGRFIVIDQKMEAKDGPPKKLRLPKQTIVDEFRKAGFGLDKDHNILPDQIYLEFRLM